ncbi:2,3-bisphosphoglycerate-dependent phosphoglycerate mutase, partial [Phenoliferia sp. Uapishka_3]
MGANDNLFVLVRHGQSITNSANVFTGILDPPLTPTGELEAIGVGQFLLSGWTPPIAFDACYTSPLVRASRSAELILDTLGQRPPVILDKALLERDYGDLNGRNKAEVAREFGVERTEAWRRGYFDAPPNGESLEQTANRAWAFFLAEMRPRLLRGEKVLCVTSGNTARGLVLRLEGLGEDEIRKVELGTAATRVYRFDEGGSIIERRLRLDEEGKEGHFVKP